MLYVTDAKYLGEHRVWLAFSDGTAGEADLKDSLHGPIFEPLLDESAFAQVRFHPEADTIVWPNGADFAPEYLHELVKRQVAASP
jgi:hypothetical protein